MEKMISSKGRASACSISSFRAFFLPSPLHTIRDGIAKSVFVARGDAELTSFAFSRMIKVKIVRKPIAAKLGLVSFIALNSFNNAASLVSFTLNIYSSRIGLTISELSSMVKTLSSLSTIRARSSLRISASVSVS